MFLTAMQRELANSIVFIQCLLYLFTDLILLAFNMFDIDLHILGMLMYNSLRNPAPQSLSTALWMIPGLLFYNIPLPALHV